MEERAFKLAIDRGCELLNAGKEEEALAAARSVTRPELLGIELLGTCKYIEQVREDCPVYRERGIEAVLQPYEKDNEKERKTTADYYRLWCNEKP